MNKNDIIKLVITDISAEGSGIGKHDGMAVFVPQTAVGDTVLARIVKLKKNYAFAKCEELLTPSPLRVEPDCAVFRQCGGCTLRHIDYKAECDIKYNRVRETMHRIGGVSLDPQPLIASPQSERYRNKAQYPIAQGGTVGFYAPRSHRIIPCGDCRLQPAEFVAASAALTEWIRISGASVYNELSGTGLVRHFYLRKAVITQELLAVLVINGTTVPCADLLVEKLRQSLGESLRSIQLNINTKPTNVVLGEKNVCLWGSTHITDVLCGVRVRISPFSFYQVNHDAAELLYAKAAEYAAVSGKTVLDLYCGAGTIGLSMASRAKEIIGVEIVPQAIEDAKYNAKQNGIQNARFICGDAAAAAEQLSLEGVTPDVVIVDPPRKGCEQALLNTIARQFRPERIVYVSCDVSTLARDTSILESLGYKLTEYTPVDMFPRTMHVECVALLSRQKVEEHIYFDVNVQDLPKTTP